MYRPEVMNNQEREKKQKRAWSERTVWKWRKNLNLKKVKKGRREGTLTSNLFEVSIFWKLRKRQFPVREKEKDEDMESSDN